MSTFTEVYSRPEIANHYLSTLIQPPEANLLKDIIARPNPPDLLDLGVGAGRTTFFFLPFVRSYLGLDLSPHMIHLCWQRFPRSGSADSTTPPDRHDFQVGDASALTGCADASSDIVLFSCSGLDCLAPDQRMACLREVRRVLRSGGVFLFSAHNLQSIESLYGQHSPIAATLPPERRAGIAAKNPPLENFRTCDSALFWDGVYGPEIELRHVYIRPAAQLAELHAAGFVEAEVLSTDTGQPLNAEQAAANSEPALHYRCSRPAGA